ncbi:ribonuclease HII [Candidatus Saccharibacteria bacterium]|nr:MAG: ribonuclease HII [Candidatus Saccharibacteria bacterium]
MVAVGLDEVGRGAWAGPLVAAAVALPYNKKPFQEDCPPKIGGTVLRDSKRLSQRQRERLDGFIRLQADAFGIGWVSAAEVDSLGLTAAVRLAMQRAMQELEKSGVCYDEIIIDGNYNYLSEVSELSAFAVSTMVGADDVVPAVSAASIIAKVARDNAMRELAREYTGYGFADNVGYGTRQHAAALEQLGVTDMHRKSFRPVRSVIERG